jgi:DNA-binding beta-propeller fold protein YncE
LGKRSRGVALFVVVGMSLLFSRNAQEPGQLALPSGKFLTAPVPGLLGRLSGFAGNLVLSPDHQYAAILNDGYGAQDNEGHQSIAVLSLSTNQFADFPESRLGVDAHQSFFLGLAFSSDEKHLYASVGSITDPTGEKPGDTGNGIAIYGFDSGKLTWERFLKIVPQKIAAGKTVARELNQTAPRTAISYPAGLSVIRGKDGDERLLVANNLSDNVVLLNLGDGRVLGQIDLSTHDLIPSSFPYSVVTTRDGRRAWCSLWNLSRVAELDLEKGTVVRWIPLLLPSNPTAPGSHPTAMTLSPDEDWLYVALANADRVMVIPTKGNGPVRPLLTSPPGQTFGGSCPDALALSAEGKRLFVADACINAVAVFEMTDILASPASTTSVFSAAGFIPTDWYPSALATAGDDLLIATSKGQGTGPNNFPGHTVYRRHNRENVYIASLLHGSVARLKIPDVMQNLDGFTRTVAQDNLFKGDPGKIQFAKSPNPIRHVIYILKENRTYDQVLGDLRVGNGDPSLTMYGSDITPNQHKMALQFGVLDNFYDSGEVSGDGHEWSMAAITSDYNERTWQIAYRSKERTYDFQGMVAGESPLEQAEPDVDAPGTGYIWDDVANQHLTYRDYGEFIHTVWCKTENSPGPESPKGEGPATRKGACDPAVVMKGDRLAANVGEPHGTVSPWPWPVPQISTTKATQAAQRDHFDPAFPSFNTEYPDQLRADEFLNEFDGFVRARTQGKGTELPQFVLLYLPDDHTHGTTPGKPRPAASVADNDLAVGRVVEAVSHSPYWDDTAILIVEDDSQDGADHVDAHRSTAYVISKYSPGSAENPFVDHHFYTTVNLIHTIEALLGLPPMNQNDAYAAVMGELFSGAGRQPQFIADWRNRDNGLIYQVNPPHAEGAEESEKMDFSRPDATNAALLNAVLWRDRKGSTPMPEPKHAMRPQKSAGNAADED